MNTKPIPRRWGTALIAAAGLLAAPAWAQGTAAHEHGHATAPGGPVASGPRWPTDAPLREGMEKIRSTLLPQLTAIHADRLAPAQYRAIATQTEAQVAYIVAHCKLQPEADAALHVILGQIGEATDAMAGRSPLPPRDGALKLAAALDKYGRRFDHPGWRPMT